MEVAENLLRLIGNTPVVELKRINSTGVRLFAKLDHLNPSGSVKDVMASYMIQQAEKKGLLKKGSEILEVTTGNTGVSFAMLSAVRGFKFTAVMPADMSRQKIAMVEAFGGKVVLTPPKESVAGAIREYKELVRKNPNAWLPKQFENRDNIEAHTKITCAEICRQLNGKKIDAFVAGVGTGGTLMGVANVLRKAQGTKIIAVEPAESAVMNGKRPGMHKIEGIGEGFIPPLVDMKKIDEVIAIKSSDAISMAKRLAKEEGLFVGISSGANVLAALKVARKMKKGNIVTILPDRGERYLNLLI